MAMVCGDDILALGGLRPGGRWEQAREQKVTSGAKQREMSLTGLDCVLLSRHYRLQLVCCLLAVRLSVCLSVCLLVVLVFELLFFSFLLLILSL